MAKSAEEISKYTFSADDELLLDTNIWFFLFGPHRPGDSRAAIYSGAFGRIMTAKSRIYVDVLIISEFINSYARLRHNILKSRPAVPRDFKQFRSTPAFKTIAKDIAADTKRILTNCTCVETGFSSLDINLVVNDYSDGDSDFNDLMLADLCRRRALKFITDDGDFKKSDITVLTANKRLLS
jgi:predicted nucleic acid-binding protein